MSYVNPNCGCPHPNSEHGSCAAGEFCKGSNCRCVDGTYYGEMDDPASLGKVRANLAPAKWVTETRNSKVLVDFIAYCLLHPEERFWQALRNWAGASFILAVEDGYNHLDSVQIGGHDTFHREGKNG